MLELRGHNDESVQRLLMCANGTTRRRRATKTIGIQVEGLGQAHTVQCVKEDAAEATLVTAREGLSTQRGRAQTFIRYTRPWSSWSDIKAFRDISKGRHFTSPSLSLRHQQQPIYTMPAPPFHQPSWCHRTRWPAWLAPIRQKHITAP